MSVCDSLSHTHKHTHTHWVAYLVDDVADVSGVGGAGAYGVLVVVAQGSLIQTPDANLHTLWLQGVRLLELTQVVVLDTHTHTRKEVQSLNHLKLMVYPNLRGSVAIQYVTT